MNDLILYTQLDQIRNTEHHEIIESIISEMENAVASHNIELATGLLDSLVKVIKVAGLALAKILLIFDDNWPSFEIDDDPYDYLSSIVGLSKENTERYVRVARMLRDEVTPEIAEQLEQKPIGTLIPVANAIHQGYEVEDAQWSQIIEAPDQKTISTFVREQIKQVEPRKSHLGLWMDRDGSLWAFKEERRVFIGSLEIAITDDELIQQAIARIVKNSGILIQ